MSITRRPFGRLPDKRGAYLYTLTNKNGVVAEISDFGATLTRLQVPDRAGRLCDVVCGFDSLAAYMKADGYYGAVVGRFANRIVGGRFTLDRREYILARNDGENHLHGGLCGFSHRLWSAEVLSDDDEPEIRFGYTSPDGEEGYPGTLSVSAAYRLTQDNSLVIGYSAGTDKKTIVNLTNHAYFNLGGQVSTIYSHVLRLDADTYLPTNNRLIPTGEIKSVEGTPFDFREPKPVGRDISAPHPDITAAGGYDHCLNFTKGATAAPQLCGELFCPESGILMELFTDQPCVQLYTANSIRPQIFPFNGNMPQQKHCALCLETQLMPNSINQPGFTDCTLSPGKLFSSTTIYKFSIK
jgi:aldose 1-epimerase